MDIKENSFSLNLNSIEMSVSKMELECQLAGKLWPRIKRGILIFVQNLFQHLTYFWVLKMHDFQSKNFSSMLAFD